MARSELRYCIECKMTTEKVNGRCTRCIEIIRDQEKARWDALSVEQKLDELKSRLDSKSGLGDIVF